jgi:hypothetical protein
LGIFRGNAYSNVLGVRVGIVLFPIGDQRV